MPKPASLLARFFSKVCIPENRDECWLWQGSLARHGYGSIKLCGPVSDESAHRVSYFLFVGFIPKGMFILHNCPDGDNPQCVNPRHLYLGTQKNNMEDRDKKDRNGNAKLKQSDVRKIRHLYYREGKTQKQLAVLFKVSIATISQTVNHKSWN